MKNRIAGMALSLMTVGLLSGCSGGSDSTPAADTPTLSGVAAVGFPIIGGVINARCAAGSSLASATTGSSGAWQLDITGQTLPCAVQVSGGTINGATNATPYHSIATAAGTVNVTPLTDMMVANLAGTATPDTWFSGLSSTTSPLAAITQTNVDNSLTQLRTALSGLAPLASINPITTAFTATAGNTSDDMLEAFATAMSSTSGVTHATLLANASGATFTAPTGFGTALTTAYANTASGGSASGGAPTITSFSPTSGAVGATVTITGTNFDPDKFHMQVAFGGNVQANIVSASATQLVVTVPAGASSGAITATKSLVSASVVSTGSFTVTGVTPSNTWTQRSSGSAYILNTVTYGNGLFLAGGLGNTIVSSPDGITWTVRSSSNNAKPDANYFGINGLAWSSAASLYIAVGDRSVSDNTTPPLLATSPDGITWTRASLAAGTYSGAALADVTADSNGITAVGAGYIFYSTDGSAWSSQAVPSGMGATLAITGVASSGATRVAVGYDSNVSPAAFILASTDASSWTRVTAPAGFAPQDVIWNGSLFVAVGSSSPIQMGVTPQIATSSDGQTWTLQTIPPAVASSAYMLNDIAWDGSRFIAVGSPYALVNSRLILSSTDGSTWTVEQEITTGSGQKVLNSIASSGTRAVTVGDSVFTNP